MTFATLYAMRGALAEDSMYFIVSVLALGAAALGGLVAALAYDPGDYMRRAWALIGLCYVLLVVDTLAFGITSRSAERDISALGAVTSATLTFVANVCSVVGTVLIARAWRAAGLDLGVSAAVRWVAMLLSLALALWLVGEGAWHDVQTLLGGDWRALVYLASSLGDIVSLALVAPILLTAYALRGGSLGWPWALLALSSVGWLLYSAAGGSLGALVLGPAAEAAARPLEESLRTFACLAQLCAGLLQASVLAASEQPLPARPAFARMP
ncbi:hypothetical protein FGE12_06665 [Aggregicoccus sp. 17bor-14]|uniref:hypothetical protein n=1 Tax=Myxococcaceae TaxID=31 RepID=UPI00129D06E0|nr:MULTISPECIES: hypothetical protein [Myxococcaceae]MBF5042071.1 hypothetical protein [Simulacricoccus sp. 17bor-14]MRI87849.1 hypothetical protein [Aggregicoccus sp. 17bor-14]